jgi:hypothetical protein
MRKWLNSGILLLAVLALGFLGFRILFPSPQKVIRRQLIEMARIASFDVNESPLAKLANSQKLGSFFADNVEVTLDLPGRGQQTFSGRDELLQVASGARTQLPSLNIQFPDIAVLLASDGQTAEVNVTVKAIIGGQREMYIEEIKFSLEKLHGDWLIHRVEPVNTLR